MLSYIKLKIRVFLIMVLVLPTIFVGIGYMIHLNASSLSIILTNDPNNSQCYVAPNSSATDARCAWWNIDGAFSSTSTNILHSLPYIFLVSELLVAVVALMIISKSDEKTLFAKVALFLCVIVTAPIIAMSVYAIARPHSQQAFVSARIQNDMTIVVEKMPPLGYGIPNMPMLVIGSLIPALAVFAGIVSQPIMVRKKYFGMTKEKLFL